jgi:hypothetical protein
VDEGNLEARYGALLCDHKTKGKEDVRYFETLYRLLFQSGGKTAEFIQTAVNQDVSSMFDIVNAAVTEIGGKNAQKANQMLGALMDYIPSNQNAFYVFSLEKAAFSLLNAGKIKEAGVYLELLLKDDDKSYVAYLGKTLIEAKLPNLTQLILSAKPLTDYKQFNNAMNCSETASTVCIKLFNWQGAFCANKKKNTRYTDGAKIKQYRLVFGNRNIGYRELLGYDFKGLFGELDSNNATQSKRSSNIDLANFILLLLFVPPIGLIYGFVKGSWKTRIVMGVLVALIALGFVLGPVIISLLGSDNPNSSDNPENPTNQGITNLVGTWTGSYEHNAGTTLGLTLTVFSDSTATFDFYNLPGESAVNGKYKMSVTYDSGSGLYTLTGTEWIENPYDLVFVNISGTLNNDTFSGRVGGTWSSRTFSVTKSSGSSGNTENNEVTLSYTSSEFTLVGNATRMLDGQIGNLQHLTDMIAFAINSITDNNLVTVKISYATNGARGLVIRQGGGGEVVASDDKLLESTGGFQTQSIYEHASILKQGTNLFSLSGGTAHTAYAPDIYGVSVIGEGISKTAIL